MKANDLYSKLIDKGLIEDCNNRLDYFMTLILLEQIIKELTE